MWISFLLLRCPTQPSLPFLFWSFPILSLVPFCFYRSHSTSSSRAPHFLGHHFVVEPCTPSVVQQPQVFTDEGEGRERGMRAAGWKRACVVPINATSRLYFSFLDSGRKMTGVHSSTTVSLLHSHPTARPLGHSNRRCVQPCVCVGGDRTSCRQPQWSGHWWWRWPMGLHGAGREVVSAGKSCMQSGVGVDDVMSVCGSCACVPC